VFVIKLNPIIKSLHYLVLGPIASVAKVLLTPNPERGTQPFSKPKFWIDVVMEQLALGMFHVQMNYLLSRAFKIVSDC